MCVKFCFIHAWISKKLKREYCGKVISLVNEFQKVNCHGLLHSSFIPAVWQRTCGTVGVLLILITAFELSVYWHLCFPSPSSQYLIDLWWDWGQVSWQNIHKYFGQGLSPAGISINAVSRWKCWQHYQHKPMTQDSKSSETSHWTSKILDSTLHPDSKALI